MESSTTGDEPIDKVQPGSVPTESAEFELPFGHLFFTKALSRQIRLKYLAECFFGIKHVQKMLPLTSEQLLKHRIELPTPDSGRKTLFLDLDETLMHASLDPAVKFEHRLLLSAGPQTEGKKFMEITFAVRPYCLEFLKSVGRYYEIYIYTASNQEYAEAALGFFNERGASIAGYLAREACLRTSLGIYIKDLMRIGNRSAKQMLLVDNLAHSFGHMISNGVPVVEFLGDSQDTELLALEQYLIECSEAEDVREFNDSRLRLQEIVTELTPYLHVFTA